MKLPFFDTDIDVIALLKAQRRLLVACAFAGLVLGVAYALLAAKWYEATLAVVPSQRAQAAGAQLAAALPALASLASPLTADVDRIEAVLNTNAVADEVIRKFGLMQRYRVKHIEHARLALRKHCETTTTRKAGVVVLTCEDEDPTRARDMAAYFGEVGNQVFGRISGSAAAEEERFLEKRVADARRDLEQASEKLRAFQEQHKIVELGEQARAVIGAMATLQAELIAKEVELSYMTGFASGTEGSVVQLRKQIGVLRKKIGELEHARGVSPSTVPSSAPGDPTKSSFFPGAMTVPELRFELEPLIREQKVQETVLLLLTQRYETAKVDAARDTSTFQVLDPPTLPTYPSSPKRIRSVLVGGALGLFVGLVLSLYLSTRRAGVSASAARRRERESAEPLERPAA